MFLGNFVFDLIMKIDCIKMLVVDSFCISGNLISGKVSDAILFGDIRNELILISDLPQSFFAGRQLFLCAHLDKKSLFHSNLIEY